MFPPFPYGLFAVVASTNPCSTSARHNRNIQIYGQRTMQARLEDCVVCCRYYFRGEHYEPT